MRGIVVVVTIMTLLLIIGMGLLGYGLVTHGQSTASSLVPPREMTSFALPKAGKIEHLTSYKDDIVMHVVSPEGEFIYFYNPERNKLDARLPLETSK